MCILFLRLRIDTYGLYGCNGHVGGDIVALVKKTVHLVIEESTWKEFLILSINRNKNLSGMLVDQIYREVSDSAFEEKEDSK